MIPPDRDSAPSNHDAAAAAWVMRLDRGLSPAEQDDYLQWLAADPKHGAAIAHQRRVWETFDRLAGLQASVEAVPDPDLLEPKPTTRETCPESRDATAPFHRGGPAAPAAASRRKGWLRIVLPLAAAAALTFHLRPGPVASAVAPPSALAAPTLDLAPIEERVLEDGSVVRLNRGAAVTVDYSAALRRVRLERGEAAFAVAKDPARPFVVDVAGVSVRAVGTAFNVRRADAAVDVIVTEGSVAVDREAAAAPGGPAPVVNAGQRVVVPLAGGTEGPQVSTPTPEEVARRLAWQPRLLTFSDEPLAVILNEFNRHNRVMLRLADPSLHEVRLSVRFRSDNVSGFLRLLEAEFGVGAEAREDGEIRLRKVR